MIAVLLKKLITLFTLVDPLCMIPLFLAACKDATSAEKEAFARSLGTTVTIGLVVSALIGGFLLSAMGISIGSMQIAGGVIAFIMSMAMVVGHERAVKTAPGDDVVERNVVPLGVPLLCGPGCMAYMIAQHRGYALMDWVSLFVPSIAVGLATWFVFHLAYRAHNVVKQSTLNLFEKIGGFLLAAFAVEMIGTGAKALFPALIA